MSDMDQSDVQSDGAAISVVTDQTVEPGTAELRNDGETVATVVSIEPVPVLTRTPSSDSPTQQPEETPEAEAEAPSLADAARSLLVFVKAHRTAGDSDLEAAVAGVEAALDKNAEKRAEAEALLAASAGAGITPAS